MLIMILTFLVVMAALCLAASIRLQFSLDRRVKEARLSYLLLVFRADIAAKTGVLRLFGIRIRTFDLATMFRKKPD
ncbi:MAG: hypothetical protein JSV44_02505, partial [Candidatus Zixiibacteriota bacterium]